MGRDRSYRYSNHFLKEANENTGQGAFMLARKEAELGSEALRSAVILSIQGFADHYRIPESEARILLLDTGVRL